MSSRRSIRIQIEIIDTVRRQKSLEQERAARAAGKVWLSSIVSSNLVFARRLPRSSTKVSSRQESQAKQSSVKEPKKPHKTRPTPRLNPNNTGTVRQSSKETAPSQAPERPAETNPSVVRPASARQPQSQPQSQSQSQTVYCILE